MTYRVVQLITGQVAPRGRGRPSRKDVLGALDAAVADLQSVGGLPLPVEAEAIWEGIWYEETHHSTAIEGNTLVLREVERLLREGKAVGSKELAEYLEVEGYAKAAEWVYAQATQELADWVPCELVSLTELREIHRLVVEPVWLHSPPEDLQPGEGLGSFRRHDIRPFAGGMTPPSFPDVPALVTDWLADATGGPAAGQHPMVFIADLHARLERIHPFRDGNGRTGRLAMNLFLPGLAGPQRLVPVRSLADVELSHNALAVAAKRRRLRAVRRTDQWYSTRQWADEYKASRYRRVPR
jgi:hypothetical protein